MRGHESGVRCGVVEWVKRSTLRWFGHIERIGNEEETRGRTEYTPTHQVRNSWHEGGKG